MTTNARSELKPAEVKIVIAYENFGSAIRAQDLAMRLAAGLLPDFAIVSNTWKFDFLGDHGLGEQAATEASEADMIVIATGARDLPAHVKNWLESWLVHKRGGLSALVALLEPDLRGKTPPLCVYLRQAAEKGSMNFFCNTSYQRQPHSKVRIQPTTTDSKVSQIAPEEASRQRIPIAWGQQ